jgi:hypothetical protein
VSQEDENLRRMREALERKSEEARKRSRAPRAAPPATPDDPEETRIRAHEESLISHDRPQDETDVRAKGTGHRKKTADKWNQ